VPAIRRQAVDLQRRRMPWSSLDDQAEFHLTYLLPRHCLPTAAMQVGAQAKSSAGLTAA
jgi:hypothetical protein